MKLKRIVGFALAAVCACSLLSGCAQSTQKEKEPLTVYLWSGSLVDELAPYLRGLVPNEEVEFIVGNNNVDLYCYMQENGDLPDIITTRRFSSNDAKALQPQLLNLAAYDEAAQYYQYALQYYKLADGSIQWLPVCGIPETMIVNKTLLDENGLEVPRSYAEFAELCQALADRGIKPYVSELAMDWAAHSLIQGAAVEQFAAYDGIAWRSAAESAQGEISFDDALWNAVFEEVDTFIKDTRLDATDGESDLGTARGQFLDGKAAIFRGTPDVMAALKVQTNAQLVRIPYFGQTSNESWIYTYPSLNIALNKNLKDDPQKLETALKVLDGFISEEGQKIIAGGSGMISYSMNANTDLTDLEGLETQIENNELYIRYASNNTFSASLEAVQGLVTGQMNREQANKAFQAAMNRESQAEKNVHFEKGYSLDFGENGRPAASSILTTVRKAEGAQLAFSPYTHFTAPIYAGDCTEKQLGQLIAMQEWTPVFKASLTGADITALVKAYLEGASRLRISTKYDLPIASGMKLTVKQSENGFALEEITVDGKPMDEAKVYSIVLTNETVAALKRILPDAQVEEKDDTLQSVWKQTILSGTKPAEPESYILVK